MNISGLVCPITKQPIKTVSEDGLTTADGKIRYPIRAGFPYMLGPEAITDQPWLRDLKAPQYEEAYAEMEYYSAVAEARAEEIRRHGSGAISDSASMRHLFEVAKLPPEQRADFPNPRLLWTSNNIEVASELDCFRHMGAVNGKRIVQVGGSGTMAMLLLLAGAAESILITPMTGEARVATVNAELLNLPLRCVIGIGEEIPIASDYADVCFVSGCIHHMRTEIAFKEIARILKPGGKFTAIEPWKAPGYALGTKIFGKSEPNPYCSPITAERLKPLHAAFSWATAIHHGAITRYPSIVASKAGLKLSIPRAEWVTKVDDAICDCLPGVRQFGSGISLLATK
jgi:uncharacterized protein YbaR (Trm112 family)